MDADPSLRSSLHSVNEQLRQSSEQIASSLRTVVLAEQRPRLPSENMMNISTFIHHARSPLLGDVQLTYDALFSVKQPLARPSWLIFITQSPAYTAICRLILDMWMKLDMSHHTVSSAIFSFTNHLRNAIQSENPATNSASSPFYVYAAPLVLEAPWDTLVARTPQLSRLHPARSPQERISPLLFIMQYVEVNGPVRPTASLADAVVKHRVIRELSGIMAEEEATSTSMDQIYCGAGLLWFWFIDRLKLHSFPGLAAEIAACDYVGPAAAWCPIITKNSGRSLQSELVL